MPEKIQAYSTIKSKADSKYKEKGSIFLAFAHPIYSLTEFEELLARYRKEYYDAVHHCSAFRLINGTMKYSDDGEPSGTAGLRIMNAIEHQNLNNVCLIVVRYFGGVKLGVGPLGKAYYETSLAALMAGEKITMQRFVRYLFSAPYELSSFMFRHLSGDNVKINSTDYAAGLTLDCFIKSDSVDVILENILTSANGEVEVIDGKEEKYFEI